MKGILLHTQTDIERGNCWQTAVACILGVAAEELPDQVAAERLEQWTYSNVLNGYLGRHHGIRYSEIGKWQFGGLKVTSYDGHHLLCGLTVRSCEANGMRNHCVVARDGAMVWDPHPSRAGLTKTLTWGFLSPVTEDQRQYREKLQERPYGNWTLRGCYCPACGGLPSATF